MLTRILYCSAAQGQWRSGVPKDLTAIIVQGRRFNKLHEISGFLVYKNGYYMQLIEGPTDEIRPLYRRIQQDSRHSDVVTLLSEDNVTERWFKDWALKMSWVSPIDRRIAGFLDNNWFKLRRAPQQGLRILGTFYIHAHTADIQQGDDPQSLPAPHEMHNYEVKMPSLPSVDAADARVHDLLEMYGILTHAWTTYRRLLRLLDLGECEIYNILSDAYKSNNLSIRRLNTDTNREVIIPPADSANDSSFYGHLRAFFRRYVR